MWTVAKDVFGLLPGNSGRKPFLNHKVLKLKKAIRSFRTVLYLYNKDASDNARNNAWAKLSAQLTEADCQPQLEIFFGPPGEASAPPGKVPWNSMATEDRLKHIKDSITALRSLIRTEVSAMQRTTLATNMERKRASLETGKRGIQRAMGKGVADARMSALDTSHPSTVVVKRMDDRDADIRQACL